MVKSPELTDTLVLELDALELAQWIREKKISSRKAVELYIAQLNKIKPAVNCLVADRFERALAEADHADRKVAEGEAKGILFGVTISMKEAFDVAGMKTTRGLLRRKDFRLEKDAE